VGYVAHTEAIRNAYRILVGETERKGPIGRCRGGWEIILKWALKNDVRVWTGFS
jgi:hypothetical protein